jgi:hypothetical protein
LACDGTQALGVPAGAAAAGSVAAMAQGVSSDAGFVVLLAVALTATSSVAQAAAFTTQEGDALAALRAAPVLACGPSAWAEAAVAAAQARCACCTCCACLATGVPWARGC